MKAIGMSALILLLSAHAYAAEPAQANPKILAGFDYFGDMESPGGAALTIYPSKEMLRDIPAIANNGGVIIVRNLNDAPKILQLKRPDLDGPEENSCRSYTGIGIFVLKQVSPEQQTDPGDDEPYTVVKGSLVSASDLRIIRSECTGDAAGQKLLSE